ncbi:hypothetical protein GRI62_13750 [Erythrobacter arachoides]|uniref:asparagine synthase (glutamine-hydrolyzing) n=1 Tax=Aurantiacibacter arachoides TaxID=1850444 RepID=A0A845A280_9SPHN|nr:asparagine synthase-related protein [Aurantiacibacter arachoides]MXO94663.1 hypothetical protein [Aurantiacibacter arachoides]GGD61718.1 asparagine synthetase B [Aurantiacibacter arachoides]
MSGIFGILRWDGGAIDATMLKRMGATMRHRAPHGTRTETAGPAGMGHCFTRIYREDLLDRQPTWDSAGEVMLVAAIRLDNREALADCIGVAASDLAEMSDSALALAAYQYWGDSFVEHLLGDFAIAIWDGPTRRLLLARDHMGTATLVYHHGPGFLAFASEPKALWAIDGVPRSIDDDGAAMFLISARDPSSRRTLYTGLDSLLGGEIMVADRGGAINIRRYWQPRADPRHVGRDEAYYIAAYREVLGEAVACRVRRLIDPPAVAFSGGFDSTAIAGLASPLVEQKGQRVIAVASAMPAEMPGYRGDARKWVEACRRKLPQLDIRYVDRSRIDPLQGFDRALATYDGVPTPFYHADLAIGRTARESGARLMMDGYFGDQTLNPRAANRHTALLREGAILRLWHEVGEYAKRFGHSRWRLLARAIHHSLPPPLLRLEGLLRRGFAPVWGGVPVKHRFINDAVERGAVAPEWGRLRHYEPGRRLSRQAHLQRAQGVTIAPHLEMAAWAHGVATTRPFADKRVVELALAIPEELQVRDGRNRWLALQALADIYPPEFVGKSSANDHRAPDWDDQFPGTLATLAAWAQQARNDPRTARMIDTEKAMATLMEPGKFDGRKAAAYGALSFARYFAWFEGRNSNGA